CGIAAIANHIEDLLVFGGNRFTDEKIPSDVVVDGMRQLLLRPHIDEQEIALLHGEIVIEVRRVMRVRAMRIDRNDGRMAGRQIPPIEFFEDEVLNRNLVDGGILTNTPPDLFNDFVDDLAHMFGGIQMTLQLLVTPDRLEDLNKIGRGHDIDSTASDQLDGSRIDT